MTTRTMHCVRVFIADNGRFLALLIFTASARTLVYRIRLLISVRVGESGLAELLLTHMTSTVIRARFTFRPARALISLPPSSSSNVVAARARLTDERSRSAPPRKSSVPCKLLEEFGLSYIKNFSPTSSTTPQLSGQSNVKSSTHDGDRVLYTSLVAWMLTRWLLDRMPFTTQKMAVVPSPALLGRPLALTTLPWTCEMCVK
mmetsp:Transcript_8826/g.23490  ORF Transcript_8826/g.23490 Transcript_8826/m.23490 type:complete len:202 (-) Transcript_8826:159-764(-)